MKYNPILCALDTKDLSHAISLAKALKDRVGGLKLGLEFFSAQGIEGIKRIADSGVPIFLDLKFHDIPNTVHGAVSAIMNVDIAMLTVHIAGGSEMLLAARKAVDAGGKAGKIKLIGVTVLTSLDQGNLEEIGISCGVEAQVLRLAGLAKNTRLDGVVCSPLEIAAVRKKVGKGFLLVVPGIRPASSEIGDQKRIMTPKQAIEQGADYLVVGRPITESKDPAKAAEEILGEIL